MIRFTWRQFRTQAAVAISGLVAVAIATAITGPHLVHLYRTTVANCATQGDCSAAATALLRNDDSLRTWLGILVIVGPGIIGIFWGRPSSPARSKLERSAWRGLRASPAPAGSP